MKKYKEKEIWVITGVSELARDKAKKLAKEEKKKIGQWVDNLILSEPQPIKSAEHGNGVSEYIKLCLLQTRHMKSIEEKLKIIEDRVYKKTILDKFFK